MRSTLFILLTFSFFLLEAKSIIVQGTIINPTERSISIGYYNNGLTQEMTIYRTDVKEDNSFAIGFAVENKRFLSVIYGKEVFEVYLSPTASKVEFEFDNNDVSNSLKFKGKEGYSNLFFNNFRKKYIQRPSDRKLYENGGLTTYIEKEAARKAMSYGVEDYFRLLEEDYYKQQRYLHNSPNLDRVLFKYLNQELNWMFEINKIAYFLLNSDRLKADQVRGYWARYAVIRNVDINDETAVDYPVFQNLLHSFVHYLGLESPGDDSKQDFAYFRFVEGNLQGKAKYYMQAKIMLDAYQKGSKPLLAQRRFKAYKKTNPYREYNETLELIFGAQLEYVPKKLVPNFTVLDVNGQEYGIEKFRGKVIYVSFWASWCAPCIRGFQETHHTRLDLERKGVVFLNVNLDKTEAEWRHALGRLSLPGANVYGLNLEALSEDFKVTSLPHYMLINKSGMLTFLTTEKLNGSEEDFNKLLSE